MVIAALLTAGVAGCSAPHSGNLVPLFGSPTFWPRGADLPPRQVIFQITGSSGLAPFDYIAAARPGLTIYGNGDAFIADAGIGSGAAAGTPWPLRKGRVATETMAKLVHDAAGSGLFDGADFGQPEITDVGATSVTFRPGGAPARRAAAYALYVDDADRLVSFRQRANRIALREFGDRLERSITFPDTRDGVEWVPTRVEVIERQESEYDDTATAPWPGPAPGKLLTRSAPLGRCGVVEGAAAARLYAAARAHKSTRWSIDGTVRFLLVRALLPGERGCQR